MAHTYNNVLIHLVFSTRNRRPFLRDAVIRSEMHSYLGGISNGLGCPIIRVGGVEDHVHLLSFFSKTVSLADWVRELKKSSTVWIKDKYDSFHDFQWQLGYGAFSVSQSMSNAVEEYIRNQEKHHQSKTFQKEFRNLLKKHGIQWDERYIWR